MGKNSLNLASGMTCSTFLTFTGLFGAPGKMFPTRALSRVQDVESRRAWISVVIGSLDEVPQIVPAQVVEGTGPPVSPPEPCVVIAAPGPSVAPPAFPPWQMSTPLKVMEENEGSVLPEKLSWKACSRYSPAFFPEKYDGLWRVKLFPDPVS